ncbi:uncharacterized protein BDV14DRAFT_32135 [Aspergillus stella-maris]|uniref:uncharacterized protein n=1 Tax=Aspergillus stella-maris TaxID=1810926 RepID=UPI003CCCB3A7
MNWLEEISTFNTTIPSLITQHYPTRVPSSAFPFLSLEMLFERLVSRKPVSSPSPHQISRLSSSLSPQVIVRHGFRYDTPRIVRGHCNEFHVPHTTTIGDDDAAPSSIGYRRLSSHGERVSRVKWGVWFYMLFFGCAAISQSRWSNIFRISTFTFYMCL